MRRLPLALLLALAMTANASADAVSLYCAHAADESVRVAQKLDAEEAKKRIAELEERMERLRGELARRGVQPPQPATVKKSDVTPSTTALGYAMYYQRFRQKLQDFGTANFPKKDGNSLHGSLVVKVPVWQDGTIYTEDGGACIERGSGNADLDAAALDIVNRSAPFEPIPQAMRSKVGDDLWVLVSTFSFVREGVANVKPGGER